MEDILEVVRLDRTDNRSSVEEVIEQSNIDKLSHLKELIYDSIRTAINNSNSTKKGDIQVEQSLDIKLSPVLARKGNINILQIQNVVVTNLIENMINMLKIIDNLSIDEVEVRKINHLDLDVDLDDFCELLINENLKLLSFQRIAKKLYVRAALMKSKTKTEAARKLGIQRTYLSRLVTILGLENVQCDKGGESNDGLEPE